MSKAQSIRSKLLKRKFLPSKQTPNPDAFKVMQFNILADGLSGAKKTKTDMKSFSECPPEALPWDYRRELIFEEIQRADPHILCMQENDHFEDFVENFSDQWAGELELKSGGPCEKIGGKPDGCSIHWKKERFQLKQKIGHHFTMGSQVFLCVVLNDLVTNQDLIVCTTHLRAAKSREGEKTREAEVKEMMSELSKAFGINIPIIITADLNASPTKGDKEYESLAYPKLMSERISLQSAYCELLGGEPSYTTAKVRGDLMAHTIDYITYHPEFFSPVSHLEILELSSLAPGYVPSLEYPSDHFSLCVEFNPKSYTYEAKACTNTSSTEEESSWCLIS